MSEPLEVWERHAGWWQAGFTMGADAEYEEQILPTVERLLAGVPRVLDLGCGEGQVARLLGRQAGSLLVAGVDPSRNQLAEAARRGGGPVLARAVADGLPFVSGCFDAVVACLVLEHVEELEPAAAEVGRVLALGGRLLLLLNHPLLQTPSSGWIDDAILEEQYWRIGPYLTEDSRLEEVDKGVWIPFVHRPLHRYVNAFAHQGLHLVHMEEPAPPPGFLARAKEYAEAATIPRLMVALFERCGR